MHIQAFPQFLTWSYTLHDDAGHTIRLVAAFMRERASFTFEGTQYSIARPGLMVGPFELRDERGLVAAAQKAAMRRSFEVATSAGELLLAADFVFTRAFSIQRQGRVIGHVKPEHAFTRRAVLDVDADVCVPEGVFLFWLAMLTWRRASRSG